MKNLIFTAFALAITSCTQSSAFFTLISTEPFDEKHFNASAPFLKLENKKYLYTPPKKPLSPLETAIMKLHYAHGGDMLVNAKLSCPTFGSWSQDATVKARLIKMHGIARPAPAIIQNNASAESSVNVEVNVKVDSKASVRYNTN